LSIKWRHFVNKWYSLYIASDMVSSYSGPEDDPPRAWDRAIPSFGSGATCSTTKTWYRGLKKTSSGWRGFDDHRHLGEMAIYIFKKGRERMPAVALRVLGRGLESSFRPPGGGYRPPNGPGWSPRAWDRGLLSRFGTIASLEHWVTRCTKYA